jgi:hypothetical protein
VRAIQVREHESGGSNCFYLIRTDGSIEDFSTFKCIKTLFPAFGRTREAAVRLRLIFMHITEYSAEQSC